MAPESRVRAFLRGLGGFWEHRRGNCLRLNVESPEQSGEIEVTMIACRFCKVPLTLSFCDLGMQPLSNGYRTKEQLGEPEKFYPLQAFVCESCWLVQVPAHE